MTNKLIEDLPVFSLQQTNVLHSIIIKDYRQQMEENQQIGIKRWSLTKQVKPSLLTPPHQIWQKGNRQKVIQQWRSDKRS